MKLTYPIGLSCALGAQNENSQLFSIPFFVAMAQASPSEVEEIEMEDVEEEETFDSDKPWHVVLLDDNHHTYDYVVEMLMDIFGYSVEKAFRMTVEVDFFKRVIVWTGHLEYAEAYQERIHNYGADWRMDTSRGSMSAILEQAR